MKEILKSVILDQQNQSHEHWITRPLPKELIKSREILVISGIRRCGKSTLLQQIRKKQIQKDFYLNFDDERLVNFKVTDFQLLHEVFIELFGEQRYFYFDEIQNITGWERFVRRLHDSGSKIFVTGSNATMLSSELGTHLTGRFIKHELYPFSFSEFLTFNKVSFTKKDFHTTVGKVKLLKHCNVYMSVGGFPLYLQRKDDSYLKSLYESILYRDVMVRNNLTNEREIQELLYHLASNTAKLSSYNALAKTVGVKNPTTIKNYLDYLENTYLLFQVNKFDYSVKKQIQNPKKIYFIDNALVKKLGFSFSDNTGRLLENMIYIELMRRSKDVFYHSEKKECDFVIRDGYNIIEAIQVCHTFEDAVTKKREIDGLIEALEKFSLPKGIIITGSTEEKLTIENKQVQIIPAWKWLLEQ